LFAALAIISLLAIPVVVPVVVMKMTGKTGRKDRTLEQAIDEPELIGNLAVVTANEETTQEEVQESFLKLNDNKVSPHMQCLLVLLHAPLSTTGRALHSSDQLHRTLCNHSFVAFIHMMLSHECAGSALMRVVCRKALLLWSLDSWSDQCTCFLAACSSSGSAGLTTLLDLTLTNWLRQPWCPGAQRQWVSMPQRPSCICCCCCSWVCSAQQCYQQQQLLSQ
jgi:hypothetical protein